MSGKSPRDCDAPAWARYKARDDDGQWHWFECHPKYYKHTGKFVARGECQRIENWRSDATAASARQAAGSAATSATREKSATALIEVKHGN